MEPWVSGDMSPFIPTPNDLPFPAQLPQKHRDASFWDGTACDGMPRDEARLERPQALTTLQLHRARLDVHGEVLEIHGAGQDQRQPAGGRQKRDWLKDAQRDQETSPAPKEKGSAPDAVEHVAVLEDAQQFVVGGDLVEVGPFLIGKEQIWLPDGVEHGGVEVERVVGVLAVSQPGVVPLLPQEDVHTVILGRGHLSVGAPQGRGEEEVDGLKALQQHK